MPNKWIKALWPTFWLSSAGTNWQKNRRKHVSIFRWGGVGVVVARKPKIKLNWFCTHFCTDVNISCTDNLTLFVKQCITSNIVNQYRHFRERDDLLHVCVCVHARVRACVRVCVCVLKLDAGVFKSMKIIFLSYLVFSQSDKVRFVWQLGM
jgi:hypothetical protein